MRAWLQRYPIALLALWLSTVPWLLLPTVVPALTIGSLLLLLLLLFVPIEPPLRLSRPHFSLPVTPLNTYLLVFLLLTGVAAVVSPLPEISLPKLTTVFLGAVAFFLIAPRLSDTHKIEQLTAVLALCAGLVALAGFFTLEWPERQIINVQPITDRLPHLSGSFTINYNEMAGTLLLFFPFVLVALRKSDGRLSKAVFAFHLLGLATLLLFTQSRGALLSLAIMGLTWLLWGWVPMRKILPIIGVIIVVAALIILAMGLSLSELSSMLSMVDAGSKHGEAAPTSWLARTEIWQVASQMIADYPVIGSGLYTFDPVSRANYPYETILPNFNLTHAHNLFLQTGTSLGIAGVLALLGLWITILARLWQASHAGNERLGRLSAVFAASITGYLFFNLYDTITFGQKPGLFVWIILAGSVGVCQLAGEAATASRPLSGKREFIAIGKAISFAPLLTLIILLFSPAFSRNLANLRLDKVRFQPKTPLTATTADFPTDVRRAGLVAYLAGDRAQALDYWRLDPQGSSFLKSQGIIALTANEVQPAMDWLTLALALEPDSAEIYLWRGEANEERGTLYLAEVDFQKAADYSANSDLSVEAIAYIYYRLGCVLVFNEKWTDAAGAFGQAAILVPESSLYYQKIGDVLTKIGDLPAAAEAYEKAKMLSGAEGDTHHYGNDLLPQ